jgi:hypothetical protein
MFNKRTLLIVGAGASQEANLPTGDALKKQIASLLDMQFKDDVGLPFYGSDLISGDGAIYNALQKSAAVADANRKRVDVRPYLRSALLIRDAMPLATSIDSFINAHRGDERIELCGKLAIVRSILEAEERSALYFEGSKWSDHPDYNALDGTWYNGFLQLLTQNCQVDMLSDRLASVTLIVFNYDRCIEHFLYHSLQTYYRIDPVSAATLVQKIKIYHPYGTVGHLPWQESEPSVSFGEEPTVPKLLDLASQIKTYTEATDARASEVVSLRERLSQSEMIVFLGFAFHRENLNLLRPNDAQLVDLPEVEYFATAKGISDSDCVGVKSDLTDLIRPNKPISMNLRNDLTCGELLREYWRSLSLS